MKAIELVYIKSFSPEISTNQKQKQTLIFKVILVVKYLNKFSIKL